MSEKQPLLYDQNGDQPPPYPIVPQSTQETTFPHEQPPAYHYQGVPFPPAPQAAQQSQTTIVLNNNVPFAFNDTPLPVRCPNCHSDVITTTNYKIGRRAWAYVGMLFLVGFLFHPAWCFCCLPCCMSSTKDVVHSCPKCDHTCGVYKRSF